MVGYFEAVVARVVAVTVVAVAVVVVVVTVVAVVVIVVVVAVTAAGRRRILCSNELHKGAAARLGAKGSQAAVKPHAR